MNSQLGISINQSADNDVIVSYYTWINLVNRGIYQFSVIPFNSKGPGEATNLMFNTQSGVLLIITLASS